MKEYRYEINGKRYRVRIREIHGDKAVVQVNDQNYQVGFSTAQVPDPKTAGPEAYPASPAGAPSPEAAAPAPASVKPLQAPSNGVITAPMPGVILKVLVDEGDMVNAGDTVMIIEAMKMENEIKAPVSGTVKSISVESGDSVNTGEALMQIEA
jgi:biotin carboxyl carrier protein